MEPWRGTGVVARQRLICINSRRSIVEHTPKLRASADPRTGLPLPDQARLRFVVGTFDSWPQLREAVRELRTRGVVLDSFNCLALQQVFEGKKIVAPDQQPIIVKALPFAGSSELLSCTTGPLASRIKDRIVLGARTLSDALGRWLIPRHATHFQDAVEAGKILLWIRVTDANDERQACQCLLTHSSDSVGVHDLGVDRVSRS